MTCYLAIDQGTHASRAVLFDGGGRVLASRARAIALEQRGGGRVEQSPGAILRSVRDALRDLLEAADGGRGRTIAACGLATQRSTLLACDDAGAPLSPALSWQDTRGAGALAALAPHHAEIRRLSGLPVSAHYGATKARWLLDRATPAGSGPRIAPLASYLLAHLVDGRPFVVDHANAQRTQLLDIARRDWSATLANWFGVPIACLPACRPVLHDYGYLDGAGIPLTAVSGDQNAALFANGPLPADTAHVNLGTGGFVLRRIDRPEPLDALLTGIAVSDAADATYLREGTVNGAGAALTWASERLHIGDPFKQLPRWLDSVDAPPLFVNAVGGIGSPWWETRLEPAWQGDADHSDAARMVAVVESILFLLADNLTIMASEAPVQNLRVTGGLSRLDGLCRRLADLTGLPVDRVEQPEATARGIAWLCAGRPDTWAPAAWRRFEPHENPGLHERHTRFTELLMARKARLDPRPD